MKRLPRVAAVHDLSCFGRCSLTVIMPVLSCMGIQVCPLPTAVLSTHFGGYSGVAFCDFTAQLGEFSEHWQKEQITFDCIYSGFLASERQIDVVSRFIDGFSQSQPLIVVDPVMGDHGKLYSVFTTRMQEQMKKLIHKADIITPNYTEACFLLGETYREEVEAAEIEPLLVRLAEFGPSRVVVTGIPLRGEAVLNMGFEKETGCFWQTANQLIPARYPGTGDIFAGVLTGVLLQRQGLPAAMKLAADFTAQCIRAAYQAGTPEREGVLLEAALPWLCQQQNKMNGGTEYEQTLRC